MDLNQVRLVLHVSAHGSLTQSSAALGVEQSIISRQLSALEKEYGERLFHRTGRGMALTEFGAATIPRLRWLLEQADRIDEEIRAEVGVVSGDVRIGLLPAFSSRLVCQLVPLAFQRHPNIKLHFFEGSNGQLQEWLANGTIDLAMLYRYGGAKLATERVLGTSDAHLIGLAGAPLVQDETVAFRWIHDLPLVLPNTPNSLRTTLDDAARQENVTLNVIAEADSIVIQKSLVRAGFAHAILGSIAIEDSGELRSARIVDPVIRRFAVLAATTRKPLTSAMRTMLREIDDLARPLLDQ